MADWIIWAVLGLLVLLGVVAVAVRGGKKRGTDYYALFVMGVTWIPLGIVFLYVDSSLGGLFFILGLVYTAVGILHKDEWKKNHRTLGQLSAGERKWKIGVIILLGLLALAGVVVFFLVR